MNQKNWVYHVKATLETGFGEDMKEKPFREIAVLSSHSLSTLARAIVTSFGFDFDHCYGFYDDLKDPYESKEMYELFTDIPEDPTPGALGVTHVKIAKAFDRIGKKMLFLFDYGDNWHFIVELIDISPFEKKAKYPRILKKVGQAPEQYPPLEEDDSIGEEAKHDDWYDPNCKLCQELKGAGVEMQWFPDEPVKKKQTIH